MRQDGKNGRFLMLIVGLNPGHDGAVAALEDNRLLFSVESEKDSYARHTYVTPMTILDVAERLGDFPDVIVLGGWNKGNRELGAPSIGGDYFGTNDLIERTKKFFGREVRFFSSSHERSHIMMAIGMAPELERDIPTRAVLVWEGVLGRFYLLDESGSVTKTIPVLTQPGTRYAFLFALADPACPDSQRIVSAVDAGKLMALAAYGDAEDADTDVIATVDHILSTENMLNTPKSVFRKSVVYNAGVESTELKTAAALLSERIFEEFASVARVQIPQGVPLYISGGCGLNCDWNSMWRETGQFSSVFVPPCPNDSGTTIGTMIDALSASTGDPHIDWTVYSGLEFEWDCQPDSARWERRALDNRALADVLSTGEPVAWVQGRWELGPRALGNRSLLAEPFTAQTRDLLNIVKRRDSYRPIAPCCRLEDAGKVFDSDFEDPYMLYFRRVKGDWLKAVTHVDGSARVQTVTKETNGALYELLSAFAQRRGIGVLCNTSLNFKGRGFINRMSDLARYCELRGIIHMVVGDAWFRRSPEPRFFEAGQPRDEVASSDL
jgi:hydroxymethyl cephem carbamoyltransferase